MLLYIQVAISTVSVFTGLPVSDEKRLLREEMRLIFRSLPDPPSLQGPLQVNMHLVSAKRMFEGEVIGPESIIYQSGS